MAPSNIRQNMPVLDAVAMRLHDLDHFDQDIVRHLDGRESPYRARRCARDCNAIMDSASTRGLSRWRSKTCRPGAFPATITRSARSRIEKISTNWLQIRNSPGFAGLTTTRRMHRNVSLMLRKAAPLMPCAVDRQRDASNSLHDEAVEHRADDGVLRAVGARYAFVPTALG